MQTLLDPDVFGMLKTCILCLVSASKYRAAVQHNVLPHHLQHSTRLNQNAKKQPPKNPDLRDPTLLWQQRDRFLGWQWEAGGVQNDIPPNLLQGKELGRMQGGVKINEVSSSPPILSWV